MVATTSGRNTRASDHVREDRLWQRHMEMAKLGATAKGGVNRQALSAEDAAARKLLGGWAAARGYEMFTPRVESSTGPTAFSPPSRCWRRSTTPGSRPSGR